MGNGRQLERVFPAAGTLGSWGSILRESPGWWCRTRAEFSPQLWARDLGCPSIDPCQSVRATSRQSCSSGQKKALGKETQVLEGIGSRWLGTNSTCYQGTVYRYKAHGDPAAEEADRASTGKALVTSWGDRC